MGSKNLTKEKVITSVSKTITDKEIVLSYIKGKTTIQAISKKGIKLAAPL